MEQARTLVRDRLGLDFPPRRDADLARALGRLDGAPRALVETLREQPPTDPRWRVLISALTVQESYFFRDTPCFTALVERVLPELIAKRREAGDLRLSLWSAGCAAGQEPYSLAMLLDRLLPDREDWRVSIMATDLDVGSLEAARAGVYGDWALRGLPAWAARHFTTREPKRHAVAERIREMVDFAPLNLASDPYPGALDLIVCRNVLMYLAGDVRHAAVGRLARALVPDGWLVVSPLDSTPESEARLLEPEDLLGVRFLRRREGEGEVVPEREPAPQAPPARKRAKRAAAPRRAERAADERVTDAPRASESAADGRVAAAPRASESAADDRVAEAPRAGGRRIVETASRALGPSALDLARAAADRGLFDEAIALCLQALRDDPLDAEAHLLTAAVEEERGDLEAAIAAARRAIYSAPDSPTAHLRLGSLLLRRGDEAAGRRSLTTAAELFGDQAPASLLARVAP